MVEQRPAPEFRPAETFSVTDLQGEASVQHQTSGTMRRGHFLAIRG
jgi:hypothetical protein